MTTPDYTSVRQARKLALPALMVAMTTALLAVTPTASAANLLVNGSFEVDEQAARTWSNRASLDGWSGGAFGIELRNNVAGRAYDGSNFIELDTNHNSSMWQTIATSLGQPYSLSFAYSARERTVGPSNGIEVFWNGLSQGMYTGNGASSGHVWAVMSLLVTGAANTSTLTFRAIGTDDSLGGSLDAVSLAAAVPEPQTWALILAGLGVVGFVARRRRPD